jgi:hypothetical protein
MRSRFIPSALFSISLFLSVSLFSASASAQENYFLLGGGLNFTTFDLDAPDNVRLPKLHMRTGFNILAGFQYSDGGNDASTYGIGYETRGAVIKGRDDNGEDMEAIIKYNYVHVAFAYKLLTQSSGPAVYAAPLLDLAILTGSEVDVGNETIEENHVNSVDLDLGLSLGVQIPMARNAIFIEAGYAYGLLNALTGEISNTRSMHNSAIKLRAGFLAGI